ncbi:MAG TPA: DsbA family oxidoreductase [Steroidobacteraceae bacterium]|nr:DsbA family oxidoreductase [Steroidobacteraceae bacterium]HNS26757.1 DsbA family oxidoreductase [Steroidobacteraceae bacterium]
MLVEVFSDTVCPWCYVGKHRFEQALGQRADLAVEVRWLPFELNPDMPVEGADRAQYLAAKFGSSDRFADAQRSLRELGPGLGIDFHFERITRMPNTRRSHALIAWAGGASPAAQADAQERVLAAYFSEGRDIGSPEVLVAIAGEAGLDAAAARTAIDDPLLHQQIATLEAQAHTWGIHGVPAFVFARRYLVSGAQEPEAFLQVIDRVVAEGATGT